MLPHVLNIQGCVGPGSTRADGITNQPQPDHRLATSAGEKEKRLLQSDNEQPNLKNWEVPTANQQMLVTDMRLIAGKD